jgi:excisionase family DNA binding protein
MAKLEAIERLLQQQASTPMDLAAAAKYIGCSKGHLYILTSKRLIPFSKPTGKRIFFDKAEVDRWLLSGRVKTVRELAAEVEDERRR